MGYNEVKGIQPIQFKNLSAGWFYKKEHNEIPGDFGSPLNPCGMSDGNGLIWDDGELVNLPGVEEVNELSSGDPVTSIYYSKVVDSLLATCDAKIFSDVDGTPADITDTLTISSTALVKWVDWQFETDIWAIGTDGSNPIFKWTGSGNAAVLGGTPPTGQWLEVWQNALWISGNASQPGTVYFSDLADSESYPTDYTYNFNEPVIGLQKLGNILFVFKEHSIGALSGNANTALTKVDDYITSIGATSGYSIYPAKLMGKDVVVFHSFDGWYALDGSPNLIPLSGPIRRKYTGNENNAEQWNSTQFDKVCGSYNSRYGWCINGIADASDTTNKFSVFIDSNRLYQTEEGPYSPHWPLDFTALDINCITTRQDNKTTFFGSSNGFVYKFNNTIATYDELNTTRFFKSKIFDALTDWVLLEANVLGDESGIAMRIYINADLQIGDGDYYDLDFITNTAVLGPATPTFILDQSLLGGQEFVIAYGSTYSFGRFLQWTLSSNDDNLFRVQEIQIMLQTTGINPLAPEE